MNLKEKLIETSRNSRTRLTDIVIEDIRKLAFEKASGGYKSIGYRLSNPVNLSYIKEHFEDQGLVVKIDNILNVITLSWYD